MNALTEFSGRLHPVLVHLPIGFLLLALLFQWISRREKYSNLSHAVGFTFLLGTVSAVLSCVSGWLLSSNGGYEEATLNLHKWFGISVAVLSAAGYLFAARPYSLLKNILSFVLLLLILITGHLGGSLTHGEGFLTKGIIAANDSIPTAEKFVGDVEEAVLYTDIIKPVLVNKCGNCHGATKQKGGLRLDEKEWIVKGGKNGKVIVNGNAAGSELYKRITLDPLDEKHMAPKGKPQLTEQEVSLVQWWIDSDAGFDKKIKQLQKTAPVATALKALQSPEGPQSKPQVPLEPVDQVPQPVLDTLRNAGIIILPVSTSSNYLLANFVSIPKPDDRTVALLKLVSKQLVWLKLSYANLADASWKTVGECKNLTRLSIEHTNITDQQLAYLTGLKQLQYLNLVGTKVTLNGVRQLQKLSQLENIYLGQTPIKAEDFATIKTYFPKARIDSGNYRVANIAADTIMLHPAPKK